jgi:hypothetical protein
MLRLRLLFSVLIFISAYSPLSVIFLIQDFDTETYRLEHPWLVVGLLLVALLSCLVVWASVSRTQVSTPPVSIIRVSNRSGELINYSIPYMVAFFVEDLTDVKIVASFVFFMFIMYLMTLKTHNIFINPILAIMGYNIYDVLYKRDGKELQDFFLVKGARLSKDDTCRIAELSERLFLVTERIPTR